MTWKVTNVQEERLKFIAAWKTGGSSMTDLCNEFGISRKTGYKYLERYEAEGLDGLKDRSHAAHHQPNKTRALITELIIEERRKHPSWGPVTLLARLAGRYPRVKNWPAVSTVGEILKREGLIQSRRKRRKVPVKLHPLSHAEEPNDLWCIDFKGHFTVANGRRCDPLTISDAVSRYLLACQTVPKKRTLKTFRRFLSAFFASSVYRSPFAAITALRSLRADWPA
jgi:transposase